MPVEFGVFQHTSRTIAFHSPLKTVGHVMLSGSPRGGEAIAALAFINYQQRNKKYGEPCHLYLLRKVFLFFSLLEITPFFDASFVLHFNASRNFYLFTPRDQKKQHHLSFVFLKRER